MTALSGAISAPARNWRTASGQSSRALACIPRSRWTCGLRNAVVNAAINGSAIGTAAPAVSPSPR